MRTIVVTPPVPVITLAEAKAHLGVDSDDSDMLVAVYVAAATATIDGPDGWLGRAIGEQVLEAYVPAPLLVGGTVLGCQPIIEVESVEARDDSGWVALDPPFYELRGRFLTFKRGFEAAVKWQVGEPEAMRVRYRAGYPEVPAPIKAAILLMTGDLFRNRDTVVASGATSIPMSTTVNNLLAPFRVWR